MKKRNENKVVISGLSGSFPKSDNVQEFMENLFAKENLLCDVPYMPCKLGKLNNLDKFDAEFFNFSIPHRVNVMDPMARIILEKAYEALVDSGNNPVTLKGKNCGVFIAIHFLEAEALVYDKIQKGASLAISRSFNANRISYWLGVHGPSFVVDSACSSSLLALEMGYKAILNGECESALVGGCHVCLHPALLLHLLKVGALNPKSESRVFDKDAGGFCKAETIGMFYLQKAKDAKRVYAEIVNVRSNHDGHKPLFLTPHGPSQQKLLKMTYEEARIDPDSVSWIEAHATGTLVGDKQEVTAIDNVFANRSTPLLIGSVKSNMGHAEAAAGVSSITKVIIAMETGFIPPNINLENPRSDIDAFKKGRIKVATEKTPWNGGIVGVSGFGMGGANSHVILKSFTKDKMNHGIPDDFLPRIICVSGRTEEAVEVILNCLEMTSIDTEFIGLLHQIHNYNIPSHPYRGYAILHKNEACLIKKIEQFDEHPRSIMFVYTNYLSDWSNIYRSLMEFNVFRTTIENCADILIKKFSINLTDILDDASSTKSLFRGFISATTIQIALTDLMKSLNIVPDYIVGYSIGELVCAYADGCLALEETLIASYYCAGFLSTKFKCGDKSVTVVIDQQYADLRHIIPNWLDFSFPSIIFGLKDEVVAFLSANKLDSTEMTNSDEMELPSVVDAYKLEEVFEQKVHFKPKSQKWILSSESANGNTNLSSYILKALFNYLSPETLNDVTPSHVVAVQFVGTKFFNILFHLKGGTAGILLTDEKNTVSAANILSALGELYLTGFNPQFDCLYPRINYPVSRGTKMIAPLIKWNHTASWPVAFSSFHERMLSGERKVGVSLDEKEYRFIEGHEIDSQVIYPGAGYLFLAWETLALMHGKLYTDFPVVFENVRFHKAVKLSWLEAITFNVMVRKGNGDFEILEKGEMVASGRIYAPVNVGKERIILAEPEEDEIILDSLDFYRYVLIRGLNYRDAFRSIRRINSRGTKASVIFNGNWITYLDGILQLNTLATEKDGLAVPVEIEKIIIDVNAYHKFTKNENAELDVILDKNMNVIESAGVQIKGCAFRSLPAKLSDRIPLVQQYLFTPYISAEEELPIKQTIYLFLHVVMDFYGQSNQNVKMVEIVDYQTAPSKLLLSTFFESFVEEQPIFQAEMKAYFFNDVDFKTSKCGNVTRVFGKLPPGELVHLIACTDLFDDTKLTKIRNSLHNSGFLIIRQTTSSDITIPSNWVICSQITVEETKDRYFLLRKKPELNRDKFKAVRVSSTTFEWVGELQEALKLDIYERIILFAECEPFNGILGFYNCLRLERNTDHVRCFFLLDDVCTFNLESEFHRFQIMKDLPVNVYKDGKWGCYVRQPVRPLTPIKTYHTFLEIKSDDAKKQRLTWSQGVMNLTLEPDDENLIHVYYATINSTDNLLFKNRLAKEGMSKDPLKRDYLLGTEFSGRNSYGIRYMGLRPYGCLSSFIELEEDDIFVNHIPNNWSMEDAVTVPLPYYVAIYAMVICGQIYHQSSVLIHSAGSVVGQAAINIANHYNCSIFVTVDSMDEKNFIKENFPQIPDAAICNVQNMSFEQVVHQQTAGKGVNMILNTRVDNFTEASVNCLANGGKFIQIKKVQPGKNVNVNKLLTKNASLHSALLEDIFKLNINEKKNLKNLLDEYIQLNAVKPLARLVYCYTGIQNAFENYCSNLLKKSVVCIKLEEKDLKVKPQFKHYKALPRFTCVPGRVYIVCGGLGGMGMALVNWLVNRGARKIVVTSRQGVQRGSQKLRINQWESYGVQFHVSKADISKDAEAVTLFEEAKKLGDVGGIFNLAAEIHDKMFKNQTPENFAACAAAKLHGTYNLDRISKLQCPHLEQFVVFSSISCGYGNLGQTNYGMFNSTVERICEQRHRGNYPALAIEWGGVGDVGIFVSMMDGNIGGSYGGCYMQSIKSCLDVLGECLCQEYPIISSLVIAKKQKSKH